MNYRHAIGEQIALKQHDEWLIIRGDHNASIGKLEQKSSSTKARGKYRCGASNKAGRDLIAWCEMNGMTWANSFMSHPDRGILFNQRYGRWYELDGFLIQQEQRHRIVKNMRIVKENSFSDHRLKELITRTVTRPRTVTTGNKKLSINHIVLKEPEKSKEYKERTEKAVEKMVKEGKIQNWHNLSKLMKNYAATVAGRMPKRRESPWLEGHEEEAQGEHKRITERSSELFSLIEASKGCLTEEEKQQKILVVKEKREERERSRKTFRKKLRR